MVLKIIHIDTKRNKAEEYKRNAALDAKAVIDSWKPEVVITSNDIAAKYLIVPYLNYTNIRSVIKICKRGAYRHVGGGYSYSEEIFRFIQIQIHIRY